MQKQGGQQVCLNMFEMPCAHSIMASQITQLSAESSAKRRYLHRHSYIKTTTEVKIVHADAGAAACQPEETAHSMGPDHLFQLLNTAVYSSPDDPQRRSAVEQLGMLASQRQALPALGSAAATFSTR